MAAPTLFLKWMQLVSKDRMRALLDDARGKLRAERIQPQSIRAVGDSVIVTIPDADQRAKADTALKTLISQVNTSGFGAAINDIDVTSSDNQIRLTLTQAGFTYRLDSALQQSLEIIRQRVDRSALPSLRSSALVPTVSLFSFRSSGPSTASPASRKHREDELPHGG